MNKKIFSALICVGIGALCACSNKSKETSADSDSAQMDSMIKEVLANPEVPAAQPQDEELIISSVRAIYTNNPANPYTPGFQKVIDDADAKAEREGNDVGYFDYDILTNSQDPGKLKSVAIIELIGNDGAKVKVSGSRFGENDYVNITVKLCEDSYLVDDVEGMDGKSVKQAAIKYIKGI